MRWQKNIQMRNGLNDWVKDKGSLSNRIKSIALFEITELKTSPIKIFNNEKAFFGKKKESDLYLREVLIFANKIPVIYARTVIPKKYLRGFWREIKRLRNSLLSEIVFDKKDIVRSDFVFNELSINDNLTKRLNLLSINYQSILVERQSYFMHGRENVLLTEVFLNNIETVNYT